MFYLNILMLHRQNTGNKTFRLEALATAIPTLVKVAGLLEISGIAERKKIKVTNRRLQLEKNSILEMTIG